MSWFINHYHCDDCDVSWDDEWSCMCDDECPNCGKPYTPVSSEKIEENEIMRTEQTQKQTRLIEAARAIVDDIMAMQIPDQSPNDFGYFNTYHEQMTNDGFVVEIQWPNLAISLEKLQQVLMELDQ